MFADQEPADQESTQHEENIDADESAREPVAAGMEADHQENRYSPQPVERRRVLEVRPIRFTHDVTTLSHETEPGGRSQDFSNTQPSPSHQPRQRPFRPLRRTHEHRKRTRRLRQRIPLDALSSGVPLNIDLDTTLTVVAGNLYRLDAGYADRATHPLVEQLNPTIQLPTPTRRIRNWQPQLRFRTENRA